MMIIDDFYKSTSWKRKRKKILRRDEYACQESRRYGKTEPATTVHHIYPLEFYPELALADWNLVSLCDKQHNAMHDRVTHEITELGKQWQERVRDKFEEWMENNKRGETQHS
ncbi:HNH endonuclease [Paenibacillus azoreducens]|uniref:HNH endonuclease n=1 Tax=Paenibacillus azoreducens TaxID=116718 RepID=UPI0039F58C0F